MKKKVFLLAGLTLATAVVFSATACGKKNGGQSGLSSNDIYGLGAVSTVKLLGNNISTQALNSLAASAQTVEGEASAPEEVKTEAVKFNEYFNALDTFLGEDLVTTVAEANTDEGYTDYATKLTVTGKEMGGNSVSYVMYYNETFHSQKVDDDETETVYTLVGVMVIDGQDYYLEGERSSEVEDGETEDELKIRAYADKTDRLNFVQMKQEYSVEDNEVEKEYVYSIYENGRLMEETSVEFETERKRNGNVETEYELEFKQCRNGYQKGKYKVERVVSGDVVTMEVKYSIGLEKGKFTIRQITGANGEKQYEYTFSDGTKQILNDTSAN